MVGDDTLFMQAVRRAKALDDVAELVVVAGVTHLRHIGEQMRMIGDRARILAEPSARDSAPAIAAAAAWICDRDPEGVAVVLASDHHLPDLASFRAAIGRAANAAIEKEQIVTLGVKPAHATSAYGYILPKSVEQGTVHPVAVFAEKPDLATAEAYLGQGYLWNSGMFIAKAATLLAEIDRFAPGVSEAARAGVVTGQAWGDALLLGEAFHSAPKISIDYAVMEHTDRAAVTPFEGAWSDLGAWDSVWAAGQSDGDGNVRRGDTVAFDTRDSLIHGGAGMTVATVGVSRLAVVAERDRVLVCDLDRAQKVKAVAGEAGRQRQGVLSDSEAVNKLRDRLALWLTTKALPLWWSLGADHDGWGFVEQLTHNAENAPAPRRLRVQARQVFVFAEAGRTGWNGPWRQAILHGLTAVRSRFRRPDGLHCRLVGEDGGVLDDTATVYDQAFVLLALAHGVSVDPACAEEALALLDRLEPMRAAGGGYCEVAPNVYQSNAHMHLLEAGLAWCAVSDAPRWRAWTDELAAHAVRQLYCPQAGVIREWYQADWRPADGEDGRRVEPGHQFEWSALLAQWAQLTGDASAMEVSSHLLNAGRRGIDPARALAVDEMRDDGRVLSARARLWPQTERLKAGLAHWRLAASEDQRAACLRDVREACESLAAYFDMAVDGLWRDKCLPDGGFADEPVPASSLYHIVGAIIALNESPIGRIGARGEPVSSDA